MQENYRNKSEKELREIAKRLDPILRLGKNGLTDGVYEEISVHLKKRRLIKLKFLPAFLDMYDRRTIGDEIARKTHSKVIQQVGGVLVLYRR
ncbi:MAG: YhbY family RNA-binding protein [Nanoarchaeota archaeon]